MGFINEGIDMQDWVWINIHCSCDNFSLYDAILEKFWVEVSETSLELESHLENGQEGRHL